MTSLSLDKEIYSTCSRKISKNQKSIKCLTCWGHTRAICIKLPVTCHQTEIDICNMCLSCSLPFYSIDDLELHFIFGDFNRLPCNEVMDRLTQLKFNPLSFDNNITNARHFENYIPENLDCLTWNYCLPNDFAVINADGKKLSILNLNIRSIANKFDSFRNLLNTLKQPFLVQSCFALLL